MGGEFLGRYMVPHEFHKPKAVKEHVAAWNARHEEASLLTVASAPLAGALGAIDSRVPGLALSILILVLLIRIAILPFTLKADRDRTVAARLAPRLKALKAQLRETPAALPRDLGAAARHRIRPVLNLLGTTAQLLLFTGFFTVVNEACRNSPRACGGSRPGWAPTPRGFLPVAISLLMVAQIAITMAECSHGARWR